MDPVLIALIGATVISAVMTAIALYVASCKTDEEHKKSSK